MTRRRPMMRRTMTHLWSQRMPGRWVSTPLSTGPVTKDSIKSFGFCSRREWHLSTSICTVTHASIRQPLQDSSEFLSASCRAVLMLINQMQEATHQWTLLMKLRLRNSFRKHARRNSVKIQNAKINLISRILDTIADRATNFSARNAQFANSSMRTGTVKQKNVQSADQWKFKPRSKAMKMT